MASNPSDRRPSAVPIHDEVRHERERLALLRRREDLEVGLRGPRVGVGPRARVLDALVLDDQPADLLELRRDQGRTPEERRSEEHTSELQSLTNLVCRLLLEKKKKRKRNTAEQEQKNKIKCDSIA